MRVNVGDGKDTLIWEDSWIPQLKNLKISSSKLEPPIVFTVADLMSQDGSKWDDWKIRTICSNNETEAILQIPMQIPIAKTQPDHLIWHHNFNGRYTVRLGYKLAKYSTQVEPTKQAHPTQVPKSFGNSFGIQKLHQKFRISCGEQQRIYFPPWSI